MKNLTKLMALMLAVVFCLFALTACRSDEKKDTADASQTPVVSVSDSSEPQNEPETESETKIEIESEPETSSEPDSQSEAQTELTTEAAPEDMVGYEEAEGEEE